MLVTLTLTNFWRDVLPKFFSVLIFWRLFWQTLVHLWWQGKFITDWHCQCLFAEDLKTMGDDVLNHVREVIGVGKFVHVYNSVRQGVKNMRESRKRAEKIKVLVDPERNAKRKMRMNVKRQAQKRRKISEYKARQGFWSVCRFCKSNFVISWRVFPLMCCLKGKWVISVVLLRLNKGKMPENCGIASQSCMWFGLSKYSSKELSMCVLWIHWTSYYVQFSAQVTCPAVKVMNLFSCWH